MVFTVFLVPAAFVLVPSDILSERGQLMATDRLPIVFTVFCLTGCPALAQTIMPLSLREAEQRAIENHPSIRAAECFAQAADEGVRQARAVYDPAVSLSLTGAQAGTDARIAAGGLNNPVILDRVAAGFASDNSSRISAEPGRWFRAKPCAPIPSGRR